MMPDEETDKTSSHDIYMSIISSTEQSQQQPISRNDNSKRDDLSQISETHHYFCIKCQEKVSDKIRHETSIEHLVMNNNTSDKIVSYGVNSRTCPIGFELLRKSGWQVGEGLGPSGQGMSQPLTLPHKTDRLGIGAKRSDTNNDQVEEQSKQAEQRSVTAREIAAEEERNRRHRLALLRYFNS